MTKRRKTVGEVALKSCARGCTPSTGITDPRDRDRFIATLELLKKNDVVVDPDTLERVLNEEGWEDRHIQAVRSLVYEFNSGKRFRKKNKEPFWNDQAFSYWVKEAEGEANKDDNSSER